MPIPFRRPPVSAMDIPTTPAAAALIRQLVERHGPIMFHLGGGCCDGSAPLCVPLGEFKLGDSDVLYGFVAGCPLYLGASLHACWGRPVVEMDVAPGRGGGFSLETPEGVRFIVRPHGE